MLIASLPGKQFVVFSQRSDAVRFCVRIQWTTVYYYANNGHSIYTITALVKLTQAASGAASPGTRPRSPAARPRRDAACGRCRRLPPAVQVARARSRPGDPAGASISAWGARGAPRAAHRDRWVTVLLS